MKLRLRGLVKSAGRAAVRPFRRFVRANDGVTAVEFAIVATPFFALMFAILETALVFFGQQTLETAVATAARQVRTGQAQAQGFSSVQFKQQICQVVVSLFDCSKLKFDVRTYATFDSLDLDAPLNSIEELDDSAFQY